MPLRRRLGGRSEKGTLGRNCEAQGHTDGKSMHSWRKRCPVLGETQIQGKVMKDSAESCWLPFQSPLVTLWTAQGKSV